MNEAKHTPGPWKAGRPDLATIEHGADSKWIYAGDQYVALASGRISGGWHEVMANAHLIAAAPDLYAAAYQLAENFAWSGLEGDCREITDRLNTLINDLRVAVWKAEGRA